MLGYARWPALTFAVGVFAGCGDEASLSADAAPGAADDAGTLAVDARSATDAAYHEPPPDADPSCLSRCDFPVEVDLDSSGRAHVDYHNEATPPCSGGPGGEPEAINLEDRLDAEGEFAIHSTAWSFRDRAADELGDCALDHEGDELVCAGRAAGAVMTLSLSRNVYEILDVDIRFDPQAQTLSVVAACYSQIPAAAADGGGA